MTRLRTSRTSLWQILDPRIEIGDTLEVDAQEFEVIDVARFPSTRRKGQTTTRLTLQGTCQMPGCKGTYTFEATKTRIQALRTCSKHRKPGGRGETRFRRGASSPAPIVEPLKPTVPTHKSPKHPAPKPLSFNVGEVGKTRNPYRPLIRVHFDEGKVDWVDPARLTKINPDHFAGGGAS